ncbi:hypothetical protein L6452_02343 [Arctium lappa]|uniref:Uncharacterized protein n=1 Tax=Arctium lappa TaxID=4217 RepID=A0ACB9FJA2_ARCLA|nr:hypothetical protein L6452_02343 [Arctium lappa]
MPEFVSKSALECWTESIAFHSRSFRFQEWCSLDVSSWFQDAIVKHNFSIPPLLFKFKSLLFAKLLSKGSVVGQDDLDLIRLLRRDVEMHREAEPRIEKPAVDSTRTEEDLKVNSLLEDVTDIESDSDETKKINVLEMKIKEEIQTIFDCLDEERKELGDFDMMFQMNKEVLEIQSQPSPQPDLQIATTSEVKHNFEAIKNFQIARFFTPFLEDSQRKIFAYRLRALDLTKWYSITKLP